MEILIGILLVIAFFFFFFYNTLIAKKNSVKNAFATIDAMLKQRFDLIPNLVATVKESAKFETSTLEKVIQMRSQMGAAGATPNDLQKIDREATNALRGLMIQVEAYPDLKSSQNFVALQNSLQTTEEQLAAARRTYNACVTNYNNALEMVPTNYFGKMMGLKPESLFEIPAEERQNSNVAQLFKN